MIFNSVSKWEKPYQFVNYWSTYYENDIESQEYLNDKEATIRKWLGIIKPKSVLDLGANTGKFSFIAAEYAERVISIEGDQKCVDEIEEEISIKNNNIFTLVGNITNPSPTIGFLNAETESIFKRCNSEVVMSLALIHHLFFSCKLNFDQIVFFNKQLTKKYILVEFIEENDRMLKKINRNSELIKEDYNLKLFKKSFEAFFILKYTKRIANSNRHLFLYELLNEIKDEKYY